MADKLMQRMYVPQYLRKRDCLNKVYKMEQCIENIYLKCNNHAIIH